MTIRQASATDSAIPATERHSAAGSRLCGVISAVCDGWIRLVSASIVASSTLCGIIPRAQTDFIISRPFR